MSSRAPETRETAPRLTVWGRTNSVNVQKVLWCLDELGLDYERREAGLEHGVNDAPWYLELNPNGRIPLLVDGAFSVWESNTIVRYLCASHPEAGLYAAAPAARADAERWMDWQLSMLARPMHVAFWGLVRTPSAERDERAIARAVAEANSAWAILDAHLARHAHVAGDALTMGDIPVGALAHRWLALPGIECPDWPHLRRWYAALAERAAYRRQVMRPLS